MRRKRTIIALVIVSAVIVIGAVVAVIVVDMTVVREAYERCLAENSCSFTPPPSPTAGE